MATSQLYRSTTNKVIAGVCGGLGEYFDIDPMIIRALFVLAFFMSGTGILLYIVLWLVIPDRPRRETLSRDHLKETVREMKARAVDVVDELRGANEAKMESRQSWLAILVVIVGVMFLLRNFDMLTIFDFERLWPLILIIFGFAILFKKR